MLGAEHRAALAAIVGEANVLTDSATAGYETPARYERGRAAAVVRPASTAEVSATVSYCVRNALSFVPQSGNTGLVTNATPDDTERQLVLSLDRLRAPLRLNVSNRTVHAGAGVRLSTLNNELQPHGLFLPIDLGADPMIGGMISTNTAGARFIRYGDMRRHVLGMEVVLADRDGTVLDLMSALRKNNTGVDFKQLFIGTGGAFGVVTQALLDVQPLPRQSATALVVPADATQAPFDLLRLLEEHAGDCLSAFEGMSSNAMAAALTQLPALTNPFGSDIPEYAILIELAAGGALGDLEDRLTRVLEHAVDQAIVTDAVVGKGDQLWTLRHSLSSSLRAAGHVLGFDLAFDRDRVLAFRAAMSAELSREFPEYRICDFGHLGDGGVHFSLLRSRESASAERDAAVTDYVFDAAVTRFGGSFSGEHGIGRANQRIYDRYTPPLHQQLASGLARVLGVANQGAVRLGAAAN